jgi:arylsulfatase A-like enzyme
LQSLAAAPAVLRGAGKPPNVLLMISDQMRAGALGALGRSPGRTPHLDRLASQGVAFANCFANNPVCVPARKSIFTSLYPHQHGSLSNRRGSGALPLRDSLLDDFRARGYRMGYVGKNHAFRKEEIEKLDFVSVRDREAFRDYNRWVPSWWHGDSYWPAEETYAHLNTEDALRFLRDGNREPFFLTVSWFDPHPPYMAPSEYTSRYAPAAMRLPEFIPAAKLSPRLEEYRRALGFDRARDSDLTETMRYYYAAVEWGVDAQVGRLMKELDTRGLASNTVVVFVSDHGDFMGEHRMVRKGMFLYDALLRVPMIWRVPGVKGGRVAGQTAAQVDLRPTLAALTGARAREGWMGRSLATCLRGEEDASREFYTSAGYSEMTPELLDPNSKLHREDNGPLHTRVMNHNMEPARKTAVLRSGEWKMILSETRPPELYRMGNGWVERENVAAGPGAAAVRRDLEQKLAKWWKW